MNDKSAFPVCIEQPTKGGTLLFAFDAAWVPIDCRIEIWANSMPGGLLQGVDCANVYGFHRSLLLGSEGAKLFMVFPTIASSCSSCLLLR